jgi:hypothetical protein
MAFAAGCLTWAAVALMGAGRKCEPLEPLDPPSPFPPRVWALAPLALIFAAMSWRHTVGGKFQPAGTAFWLASILVWFVAWWPSRRAPRALEAGKPAPSRLTIAATLLAILAVAAFFRFYRLSEIPPQPGSDQAEDLLNVVELGSRRPAGLLPEQHRTAPFPSTSSTPSTRPAFRSTT